MLERDTPRGSREPSQPPLNPELKVHIVTPNRVHMWSLSAVLPGYVRDWTTYKRCTGRVYTRVVQGGIYPGRVGIPLGPERLFQHRPVKKGSREPKTGRNTVKRGSREPKTGNKNRKERLSGAFKPGFMRRKRSSREPSNPGI